MFPVHTALLESEGARTEAGFVYTIDVVDKVKKSPTVTLNHVTELSCHKQGNGLDR